MPLFVADYLADTQHLNAEEHGVYLLLLMHQWQHGSIPNDEELLSRIAKMQLQSNWSRVWRRVSPFFKHGKTVGGVDETILQQGRCVAELEKAIDISEKRRNAALQRRSKTHANAGANAGELHMQSHMQNLARARVRLHPHLQQRTSSSVCDPPTHKVGQHRHRLGTNFLLNETDIQFATEQGWDLNRVQTELARFRDHAKAKDRKAADWHAAWRMWVTDPLNNKSPNGGQDGTHVRKRGDIIAAADQLVADAGALVEDERRKERGGD
jgi:uncharacterized protein YdaU (DUF1376 family)